MSDCGKKVGQNILFLHVVEIFCKNGYFIFDINYSTRNPLDHVPKQKAHSVERGKLISFFFSPWLRLKQDVYFVVLMAS